MRGPCSSILIFAAGCGALVAPAVSPAQETLRVVFAVESGAVSSFGLTSPMPSPLWDAVARQLSRRLRNFDARIEGRVIDAAEEAEVEDEAVVVCLGTRSAPRGGRALLADESCSDLVRRSTFVGSSRDVSSLVPWSRAASCRRALEAATKLLNRKSTEDACFGVMLVLNLWSPIDLVATDINPSWDKGIARNVREFRKMLDCCGPEIFAALSDPQTKKAIDLLNARDLRDQVGSYRVIVSNETPQLERFSLCILQQHNCFGADARILETPRVPPLGTWRGRPLDAAAASAVLVGHLGSEPWSWRVVCGANPAYDAFPMQHQIFYESAASGGLWYDPVFLVETLDGDRVWTKRHYRCVPRGETPGLWTLSTLDNGVVSKEHWTTVDVADDLEFAVLHYSGAAKCAGQSYQGALLCSRDGFWPASAPLGTPAFDRIRAAFAACGLELFELYGCGPPLSTSAEGRLDHASFMWAPDFRDFAESHPPPLRPVGDISITKWRDQQRREAQSQAALP